MIAEREAAQGAQPHRHRCARQTVEQLRIEPAFDEGTPVGAGFHVIRGSIQLGSEYFLGA